MSISEDGFTAAVAGLGGNYGDTVSIFNLDLATKDIVKTEQDFGSTRGPVALSPDGQLFATCNFYEGEVRIYETSGFQRVATNSSAHVTAFSSMAFSQDGSRLITADANGMIKIWSDPRKLDSPEYTLKGHLGGVFKVYFSADGGHLISNSADKTSRIWKLPQPGAVKAIELKGGYDSTQKIRFSPDGLLVAAADSENRLHLWGRRHRRAASRLARR